MGAVGRCVVCGGAGEYEAEYRWPDGRVYRQTEPCGDCPPLIASAGVPRDEVWICEPLTPLQRAAGFAPRVLGKIVGIGD